jgi:hypothetical protein
LRTVVEAIALFPLSEGEPDADADEQYANRTINPRAHQTRVAHQRGRVGGNQRNEDVPQRAIKVEY